MGRGQTNKQTHTQTSQLLDQLGPEAELVKKLVLEAFKAFYRDLIQHRCTFLPIYYNKFWVLSGVATVKQAQKSGRLSCSKVRQAALLGMMTLEYPVTLLIRNPFSPITPRPHRQERS